MSRLLLLVLLLVCCIALPWYVQAQEAPPPPAVEPGALDQPGPTVEPTPGSPLPPVVPPEPAPVVTPTPGPGATGQPGQLTILADREIFNPVLGIYQFYGNVSLETRGLFIRAAELSYLAETDMAVARGNVSIRTEDGIVYWGTVLEYHVRTRQWRFRDFSVEYPPEFLRAPFVAPVLVGGEEVSGLPFGVRTTNSTVTTCDLPNPHYVIISRRVDIYPGDKLIAYDNDIYVLGHRILHIPWFYLSLRQRRVPIVPEFGQNDFEGYYGRFLYQYVLNSDNIGGIRLDLTQKRGPGLGVDHFYNVPHGYGEAFGYARQGLNEYVLRLDHTQALPENITANMRADVRQDSFFTAQPTTLTDINTRFQRPSTHTNTAFTYTRRLNESFYKTDSTSANLRYNLNTAGGGLSYSAEYTSFGQTGVGTTTAADQELWNRLLWTRQVRYGQLNLRVDQRTDVDGEDFTGDTNFFGVQRLPEVYLETNQNQQQYRLLRGFPNNFIVGWGAFRERTTDLNRYLFNWRANPRARTFGRHTLEGNASFRQTVYGDPDMTALYAYSAGINVRSTFNLLTNSLRYSRQDSHGFTPFSFDVTYPYETVGDAIEYRNRLDPAAASIRMSLSGGRDLEYSRWQDITFRGDARLSPTLTTTQYLGYDPNKGDWRDLVSQFSWSSYPPVVFNLGSRYDLETGRLRRVSTELEWIASPVWRIQWLGSYDGLNKHFLYNEYLVTRDLHCWDASVYYSFQRKYFYLYIRLKALNLPLPQFGIGRGGQVLDTSQGIPF